MAAGRKGSHTFLAGILALCLGLVAAPAAARADEGSSVADEIANHLVVPEGVDRGIVVSDEGVPQGLDPEYGRISSGDDDTDAGAKGALPSKFDLRSKNAVTAVKNQYWWLNCWTFGATASLESSLIMQGRGTAAGTDLSEKQLTAVRRTVFTEAQAAKLGATGQGGEGVEPYPTFNEGMSEKNGFLRSAGHITEVSDAVFSGMGPVAEKDAPFSGELDANGNPKDTDSMVWGYDGIYGAFPMGDTDWSLDDPLATTSLMWLDEAPTLGTLAIVETDAEGTRTYKGVDKDAMSAVKRALMSEGAVVLELYSGWNVAPGDTAYYNSENAAQYVWNAEMYSHIAAIVGWDDTYPAENFDNGFNMTPPADGAWIIKDSYGTSTDERYALYSGLDGTGYRYVSYYDQSLRRTAQLVAGDSRDADDVVLQHDLLGTSPFSDALLTDSAAKTASVFTAGEDMYLEATTASSVTADADVTVEVYLLDAAAKSPTDGELVAKVTRSLDSAGRFRIELSKPVAIRAGQRFSIVEEVRQDVAGGGTRWYLGLEGGTTEEAAQGYHYTFCWHAKANPGESYVMMDGMWADARTLNENAELTMGGENVFGNALIKAYGCAADLDEEPAPVESGSMHRLYNQWTGEHFYTANDVEKAHLERVGWTYEGVGWVAPAEGDEVWRLYNPYVEGGDHHYTLDKHEYEVLGSLGWKKEDVGWHSAPASTGVAVWRQYNPYAVSGAHNFTVDEHERDALVELGWRDEDIAWYGLS